MSTLALIAPKLFAWTPRAPIVRYALSVGAVILATCLRLLLDPMLGLTTPYITYFLAVVVAGWIGGGGPAAFAVIISAAAASVFFLPPIYSLSALQNHTAGLVVFMIMGGLIALTCEVMKQMQHRAEQQAELLNARGHMLERQMVELERHKESLAKSEQRLSLTLDATTEGVWDWNIQTGEVFFSRRWTESLGYSAEDVPLHISFWESIVHPDDLPRMRAVLQAHLDGHTPTYECQNRLRMKSGVYRWNLDRGKVVERDSNGKPLRMVGTDTDITERKQVEDALHEREAQLQETVAILEASRTALTDKVEELEMFHDVVVGRELKMMELEKELAAERAQTKSLHGSSPAIMRHGRLPLPSPLI